MCKGSNLDHMWNQAGNALGYKEMVAWKGENPCCPGVTVAGKKCLKGYVENYGVGRLEAVLP